MVYYKLYRQWLPRFAIRQILYAKSIRYWIRRKEKERRSILGDEKIYIYTQLLLYGGFFYCHEKYFYLVVKVKIRK